MGSDKSSIPRACPLCGSVQVLPWQDRCSHRRACEARQMLAAGVPSHEAVAHAQRLPSSRGEITASEYVRRLDARIAERRKDDRFADHLERIVRDDAEVLQRLKEQTSAGSSGDRVLTTDADLSGPDESDRRSR